MAEKSNSSFLGLLALLLIIPVIVLIYIKRYSIKKCFVQNSNSNTQILELQENQNISPSNTTKSRSQAKTKTQHKKYATDDNDKLHSKTIRVTEFKEYVKDSAHNVELERQHALILTSVLRKIYETTGSSQYFDYVDMEYTNGSKVPKAYIVTEIPTIDKAVDFWNTIWEENVQQIVLIGNPQKEKSKKYWPEKGKLITGQKISVQLAFTKTFPNYKDRTFVLICEEQVRQVTQIHYLYCGLNAQKYVPLFTKLSKVVLDSKSPICVHSSDGLRETGLVLLCDMCLRTARKEGTIDVLRNLKHLSDHNADMVDNVEHYKLAHFIIFEFFWGANSEPDSNEYMNF